MSIICYAQRLLNPFRGVVNVIKYQSAEAVTMDGVHWDIYVANESLREGLKGKSQISDIRYGSWSVSEGLKRGPIYPSDDFKRMEVQGHIVYEYLRDHHQDVPFDFTDRFELWLLEENNQPLALIHSVLTEEDTQLEVPVQWRAGFAAAEHFASAVAGADNSANLLDSFINSLTKGWQWVERNPQGGGVGLAGGKGGVAGQLFGPDAFPTRFLFPERHKSPYDQLVADYLDWQAPWLLLLDTLSSEDRRGLEVQARKRAQEMVRQHQLYPAVVDPAQIKAALVEMVLREKQPETKSKANPGMSPFYMEISPAGGEYT